MRRTGPWLLVGVMLVAGVILIGVPFFVNPAHDAPVEVDAVFVMSPHSDASVTAAWAMVDAGLADHLMVAMNGDADATSGPLAQAACAHPGDVVVCAPPDTITTRAEAEWLRDQAAASGWDRVAIVTDTAQISRTRMIANRCFDGQTLMIKADDSSSPWQWVAQYASETTGTVAAIIQGGCGEPREVDAHAQPAPSPNPADASRNPAVNAAFAPEQPVAQSFPDPVAYADAMFAATNEVRAQRGLDPLAWSDCLADEAAQRAADVLPVGELEHAPIFVSCDPANNTAGENLVHGIYMPHQAVAGLIGSPGHRANMLSSAFTDVGVACIESSLEDKKVAAAGGDVGGMLCSMVFEGAGDY